MQVVEVCMQTGFEIHRMPCLRTGDEETRRGDEEKTRRKRGNLGVEMTGM